MFNLSTFILVLSGLDLLDWLCLGFVRLIQVSCFMLV